MNVLQIMKQARFEVDAIRASNTASGMWLDEEVLSACNIAMDRTARLLRLSGSELLTKTMTSSGSAVDLITESYSPSSLTWVVDQTDYTLPPDYVRLVSLRITTTGFDGIRFRPATLQSPGFMDQFSIPVDQLASGDNSNNVYYYSFIGPRTIRFAPAPQDVVTLELIYHYRAPRLKYYNTGTIARTNADATITGTSTEWVDVGLRTPLEFLPGITAASSVDLSTYYPTVNTLDSNTSLELRKASTTTSTGTSYFLAMVPVLPAEHHTWLAQLVAAIMYRKVDADTSGKLQADLALQLLEQVTPEITLRQIQESLIAEAFGLWV